MSGIILAVILRNRNTELKVLLLSKYSRQGASSRLRSLQFLPYLKQHGISVTHSALFGDRYLSQFYAERKRSSISLLRSYQQRVSDLIKAKNYDLLWIEYEALPYIPFMIEHCAMPHGVPYVVDYDDAVYHNYDQSSRWFVRSVLGGKIDRVMANATIVICGNDYLASRARDAGARNIQCIPTVVDANRYKYSDSNEYDSCEQTPIIGWIGSPSTERYILELKDELTHAHLVCGARLLLIGASQASSNCFHNIPVEVRPWSEDTEAEGIADIDIGIMPLPDGPWERGKCGYKLIQYMASGKPVIASPVGVNQKIVADWNCGLLAAGRAEWRRALEELASDFGLRQRMGRNGRAAVEQHYSLEVQAPHLIETLRAAAASG